MMELIYRDKLLEAIDAWDYCGHCYRRNKNMICSCDCDDDKTEEAIVNLIKDTPAVDAVEVVRCKDCKWWGNAMNWDGHTVGGCDFVEMVTDADGYCYMAVRKEVQE